MARPRIDPENRYADIMPLWRTVLQRQRGELRYDALNEDKAISLMFRLHMARKAIRERDGRTELDLYVVRRTNTVITISKKESIDWSKVTDENGRPIDYQEVLEKELETERLRDMLSQNLNVDQIEALLKKKEVATQPEDIDFNDMGEEK